jgi:uncharacterized membrane protein YgcG
VSVEINPKTGEFAVTYCGPYSGLHVQAPETLIPDSASPSMSGVQLRNAELRSMPVFALKFAAPDAINPFLGQYSFLDANSVAHTVAWTSRGTWQLAQNNPPPLQPWSYLGGPALTNLNPISYRSFANVLYYTNGSPFVASWDGITAQVTGTQTFGDTTIASSVAGVSKADAPTVISGTTGPLALGGLFLAELDNHLLLANVSVLDQLGVNATNVGVLLNFPQRLWWSANGLPNQWDFAANTNAGENDFLDVPDSITGVVTIGQAGYLFRTNGITQFVPTGNGVVPFQFDHLWASEHGVGNVYPWSIHSYGAFACFISVEQIYQIGINSFSDIGGTARDQIMADLSISSGTPVGMIVPTEALSYVYLTYRIAIPLTTFTREYIYSFEQKSWEVRDHAGLLVTGREEEIWTGQLASFGVGLVPPSAGVAGGGSSGGGTGGSSGGGPTGGGGSHGGKFYN